MRRIVCALFLFVPFIAVAQQSCDELVPKLLDASGTSGSLSRTSDSAQSLADELLNREGSMPLEAKREIRDVLVHYVNVDRMTSNVKAKLRSSCDAAAYGEVLSQMQSPLGQKMLKMELGVDPERMKRFAASFSMQSPRESRMRLIRALVSETKAVDTWADDEMIVMAHLLEAVRPEGVTKDQLSELREQFISHAQPYAEAIAYYIYRPASDEELEQYASMQDTKAYKRFNGDMAKAFAYSTSVEAGDLEVKLKKVVSEIRAKRAAEQP